MDSINLESLVNEELDKKRLLCWKNNHLIYDMVLNYMSYCKVIHHMGLNSYKHTLIAFKYLKQINSYK